MSDQILLTPGPTPIPPQVLAAEALPIIHHRTKEFADLFAETHDNLQYVFQTKNKVFTLASSGTGGMECAVANLVSAGDKVVVCSGGVFGERWIKILNVFGAQVVAIRPEWGSVPTAAELQKAIDENPDVKVVFSTHTDTSTATAGRIEEYGQIVAKTKAILVVDSISGLGGQPLYMDKWNCDVVISASQKGLMAAPGLGFISVSEKAWPFVEQAKSPRFYWDLRTIEKSWHSSETPYTPAISLIRSVNVALKMLREKTLEKFWQETADLAKYTRTEGEKLGLKMFAKDACQVLTGFYVPEGINGDTIVGDIIKKYNISMAGGQEKLKGRIIRIAHMGYIQKADLEKGFAALAEFLKAAQAK